MASANGDRDSSTAEELGLPVARRQRPHRRLEATRSGPPPAAPTTTASLIPAVRAAAVHAAREAGLDVASTPRRAGLGNARSRGGAFLGEGQVGRLGRRSARGSPASRSSRRATARRTTTAPTRESSARSSPRSSSTSRRASSPVEKVVAVHDCGLAGLEDRRREPDPRAASCRASATRSSRSASSDVRDRPRPEPERRAVQDSRRARTRPRSCPIRRRPLTPGKNNAHARGIGEPADGADGRGHRERRSPTRRASASTGAARSRRRACWPPPTIDSPLVRRCREREVKA